MRKLIACVCMLFFMQACNWVHSPPGRRDFEIAARITDKNIYNLEKMGFTLNSTVGPGDCTISMIGATLRTDRYKFSSPDEARPFIVQIINDFIRPYNEEKEIRMYLQNYPLIARNFDISLFFIDPKTKKDVKPPYISFILLYKGKLRYFHHVRGYISRLVLEETFEEAQKRVHDQKEKEEKL